MKNANPSAFGMLVIIVIVFVNVTDIILGLVVYQKES